ncbi:MAG: hypothetical protein IPM16_17835 [Chloroflexi bacterium]|nr:hypothetical protein [Chloroflexota bacterium]
MTFFAPRSSRIRRKRRSDSDNELPLGAKVNRSTDHSPVSDMLQLQRTVGNKAAQKLLDSPSTDPVVQRLTSYKSYKKSTSAWGKRDHIRALDVAYKAYMKQESGLNGNDKLVRLKQLVELCDAYLTDPTRQTSKRRAGVITLKQQLLTEINKIKVDFVGGEFSEGNVTERKDKVLGGQMNKLDYIKYSFGVTQETDDQGVTTDKKVEGGELEAYFKPQVDRDPMVAQTRGAPAGIPTDNPKFAERAVATYEVAKLLDPSIIPPTFMAKHQRDNQLVDGFIMKKVEGVTGSTKVDGDYAFDVYKNDPIYRQQMSKLMLLDFICGQVDRHPGNYMIETSKEGKVIAVHGIDNDLSFGDKYTDTTYGGNKIGNQHIFKNYISAGGDVTELTEIDRKMAERIITLAGQPQVLRAVLSGLLSSSEVDAAIGRLLSLANFLRPLVNGSDQRIKTKWE